jgi:hypothetical protein
MSYRIWDSIMSECTVYDIIFSHTLQHMGLYYTIGYCVWCYIIT